MHRRQPGQHAVLRRKRDAISVHALLQHLDQRVEVFVGNAHRRMHWPHRRALIAAWAAALLAELLGKLGEQPVSVGGLEEGASAEVRLQPYDEVFHHGMNASSQRASSMPGCFKSSRPKTQGGNRPVAAPAA